MDARRPPAKPFRNCPGRRYIGCMSGSVDLSAAVKRLAQEAGFARVGIAPAGALPDSRRFRRWLVNRFHADMAYMARHVAKRHRPDRLVEGARSVICLAVSYAPSRPSPPR